MTQKTILWVVVAALIIGAGALVHYQQRKTANTNPIKIGALISQTGVAASFGEPAKNAIQMAVDEINKNGGVDGRLVEVHFEDDHTDPKQAVSAFQKLITVDQVDGVVGGLFDFAVQPVFPLADSNKVTLISPTNFRIGGGFELTPNTFVMFPEFSSVIRELKPFVTANKTKKLAVVHFESVFGNEIAKTLNAVMQELGQGPIMDETYKQIGGNDFRTTILKLRTAGVDTVFLDMVDVDPVNFITQAHALGYHPAVISYNAMYDSFVAPGQDVKHIEGAVILDWELSSADFSAKYQARFNKAPAHSASKSYAAVYALAQAIAATENRSQVAPYLESNVLKTPEGDLKFNKNHSVDSTPVKVWVVKDGKLAEWKAQ